MDAYGNEREDRPLPLWDDAVAPFAEQSARVQALRLFFEDGHPVLEREVELLAQSEAEMRKRLSESHMRAFADGYRGSERAFRASSVRFLSRSIVPAAKAALAAYGCQREEVERCLDAVRHGILRLDPESREAPKPHLRHVRDMVRMRNDLFGVRPDVPDPAHERRLAGADHNACAAHP